ncbi:hypothetical protein N4T56_00610 [Shewanella sp. KJ10-1]|uniref:Uncharacterized protein n=1 Tax=Shewanella phaeophyticola TaxID=2978345 RepID=A0ABT2NY21_9GAMM|nr:hypothetical protein [Shewanella sp. KJ10-1]MCT8985307.1 hypothetical protein [Shewanella sp. KJ10-1]
MSQSTHNTVSHTSQWLTLAQWVGRNHVSIKQQHMLANALPLARISIDY